MKVVSKRNLHIKAALQLSGLLYSILLMQPLTVHATSLAANYSQLDYNIDLLNGSINLTPVGGSLFFSTDLDSHWSINAKYQNWQDDTSYQQLADVNIDLNTYGGGISYFKDDWFLSTSLSYSIDTLNITSIRRENNFRKEETKVTSIGVLAGYNWDNNNWLYDVSIGIQYNDWNVGTKQQRVAVDERLIIQKDSYSDNSTAINSSASLARYWLFEGSSGLLIGGLISWNYMLSGDEELLTNDSEQTSDLPRTRLRVNQRLQQQSNNSPVNSRVTSGDDNFGQVSLFISYDFNDSLSFDVDTAIEVASDDSNSSYSVGLSYSF